MVSKRLGRAFTKRGRANTETVLPPPPPTLSPLSESYDFEREVQLVRHVEQSSKKLYKDMKKSSEASFQPNRQLSRIAQDLNSTSYRSRSLKGLCVDFNNHASQLQEMGRELRAAEEAMFVEPIKKFHRVFPHVNAAIKKRERKLEDYEKTQAKLDRLTDSSPRYDTTSRAVQISRMEFEQYEQKIARDMPWLYEERLEYIEPCVDAIIQSQLAHYSESARLTQNMVGHLDNHSLHLPDIEYRALMDKQLANFRTLSIPTDKVISKRVKVPVNFNDKFLCLVRGAGLGELGSETAGTESFLKERGLEIVRSPDGSELPDTVPDNSEIVFVLVDFESTEFCNLSKTGLPIITPNVIRSCMLRQVDVPFPSRPMLSAHMYGLTVIFTGFREQARLDDLVKKVHLMGGAVRKEIGMGVTHLVAHSVLGTKYQLALSFGTCMMSEQWVQQVFEGRGDPKGTALDEEFSQYTLSPFTGLTLWFCSFPAEDQSSMETMAQESGAIIFRESEGAATGVVRATHCVMGEVSAEAVLHVSPKIRLVNQEWFWESIRMEACADDSLYSLRENKRHSRNKPRAKRRRQFRNSNVSTSLHEASVLTLSPATPLVDASATELDPRAEQDASRRHIAVELLQTEENFVNILDVIINSFKRPIDQTEQRGGPVLSGEYSKTIFGNLEDIYETHKRFKHSLEERIDSWDPNAMIGQVVLTHAEAFSKVYPPFTNFYEQGKRTLDKCRQQFPRFHAFLKVVEAKPECLRQPLVDLLIQPVQRLPRLILLLQELSKHTSEEHPDSSMLLQAISKLRSVLEYINEDKRKTQVQMQMFEIVREIQDCPPDLLASHRHFVTKLDFVEPQSSADTVYTLFLFNDYFEIAKNRGGMGKKVAHGKTQYKHNKYLHLSFVQIVIDVKDMPDYTAQNTFAILNGVLGTVMLFRIVQSEHTKEEFIKILCKTIVDSRGLSDSCEDPSELLMSYTWQQLQPSVANESGARALVGNSPFKLSLRRVFDKTKKVHRVFSQKMDRSKQQKRTRSKLGLGGSDNMQERADDVISETSMVTPHNLQHSISSNFTPGPITKLNFCEEPDPNDSLISLAPNLNYGEVPPCSKRVATNEEILSSHSTHGNEEQPKTTRL